MRFRTSPAHLDAPEERQEQLPELLEGAAKDAKALVTAADDAYRKLARMAYQPLLAATAAPTAWARVMILPS